MESPDRHRRARQVRRPARAGGQPAQESPRLPEPGQPAPHHEGRRRLQARRMSKTGKSTRSGKSAGGSTTAPPAAAPPAAAGPADFEKLGVFYLGRAVRPRRQASRSDELLLYDSKDLVTHAVCVGMTGSGKTGLCLALLEEAAIDGIPAIVIDPKGDLAQPAAHVPRAARRTTSRPWVNEDEARAQGRHAGRVRRAAGRALAEGPGRRGARTARASSGCATRPTSRSTRPAATPGLPVSILQVVRRAAAGDPRGRASCSRERDRHHGDEPARPARHRRRPDAEPRAHPARRRSSSTPGAQGRDLDLAGADPADPDAAGAARRRARPRVVLPGEGPLRAGDAAEQPAGRARLRGLAGGRAARRRQRCCYTPAGKPRVAILSIAHLGDAERMFFVTLLLNQMLGWMRTQPGTTSLRALALHGRDLRLLPAGREPAVEAAAADAAQAGARLRPRRGAGDAEPGRPRLQGALATPAPGSSAGCRPSATRRACSTGSKAPPPAPARRFDRGEMEQILAGLGNRVFLMNNVHEDAPGGLRDALGAVVPARPADARPDQAADGRRQPSAGRRRRRRRPRDRAGRTARPRRPRTAAAAAARGRARPCCRPDVPQHFVPVRARRPPARALVYQPMLLGAAHGALRRRQGAAST